MPVGTMETEYEELENYSRRKMKMPGQNFGLLSTPQIPD
jgi:hypothetical protein